MSIICTFINVYIYIYKHIVVYIYIKKYIYIDCSTLVSHVF